MLHGKLQEWIFDVGRTSGVQRRQLFLVVMLMQQDLLFAITNDRVLVVIMVWCGMVAMLVGMLSLFACRIANVGWNGLVVVLDNLVAVMNWLVGCATAWCSIGGRGGGCLERTGMNLCLQPFNRHVQRLCSGSRTRWYCWRFRLDLQIEIYKSSFFFRLAKRITANGQRRSTTAITSNYWLNANNER